MNLNAETVLAFHCPRWDELPSLPLYMDQVTLVLEETLRPLFQEKDPILTPAMINNYVKQKIMPAPHKKKYRREHMAALMVISLLKRVLSMPEIGSIIAMMTAESATSQTYNNFCAELERTLVRAYAENTLEVAPRGQGLAALQSAALTALIGKLLVQDYLSREAESKS